MCLGHFLVTSFNPSILRIWTSDLRGRPPLPSSGANAPNFHVVAVRKSRDFGPPAMPSQTVIDDEKLRDAPSFDGVAVNIPSFMIRLEAHAPTLARESNLMFRNGCVMERSGLAVTCVSHAMLIADGLLANRFSFR